MRNAGKVLARISASTSSTMPSNNDLGMGVGGAGCPFFNNRPLPVRAKVGVGVGAAAAAAAAAAEGVSALLPLLLYEMRVDVLARDEAASPGTPAAGVAMGPAGGDAGERPRDEADRDGESVDDEEEPVFRSNENPPAPPPPPLPPPPPPPVSISWRMTRANSG